MEEKMQIRRLSLPLTVALFFLFVPNLKTLAETDSIIRAKIGIALKSDKRITRATAHENIRPGDMFRIFVHPEKSCTVYIVYTDETRVHLLHAAYQDVKNCTLILPSVNAFYNVDGANTIEKITIICSPQKLPEIDSINDETTTYTKWAALLDTFTNKSKLIEVQKYEKPFSIAGNVRGTCGADSNDAFLRKLQIYSGKGLLVKTYAFKVKK